MQQFLVPLFFLFSVVIFGQKSDYSYTSIPKDLLENANSVVRYEHYEVEIPNQSSINIKHTRVVTVLNKLGRRHVESFLHYDDVTRVKNIKAVVLDKTGNELKDYKRRDFKDVSAVGDGTLYSDSRLLYLNYTPTSYPYTLIFETETISKNTVMIPDVYANDGYYSSTQTKSISITYNQELGLRYKTSGISNDITITENAGSFKASVKDAKVLRPEMYSPGFKNIVGRVTFALDNFNLEGVDGNGSDWNTFGQWMNENLLNDVRELPEETIAMAKQLVSHTDDPIEKAQIIYDYVQQKTRYISVQVGIGGWKPMLASEVDKLGYGDCKALTNYTKSLLDAVGVTSYYTVLYGSSEKQDILPDFAGIQGNHVILTVPDDEDYIWLECTSQTVPFGFIAGFTDDRDVLVIKPEGGVIAHTKEYKPEDNYQKIKGSYAIDLSGNVSAQLEISSGGLQYGDRYELVKESDDEQKEYYYEFFDFLNSLELSNIALKNEKNTTTFTEKLDLKVDNYGTFAGDEMLIPINLFNRYKHAPEKVRDRQMPVEITRGFKDMDEVEISIPKGYQVTAQPEDVEIKSDFGYYAITLEMRDGIGLTYKRTFQINEGSYKKERYADFRKFIRQVMRFDNQKMILNKI